MPWDLEQSAQKEDYSVHPSEMSTRFGISRGVRTAGGVRTNTWAVLDSDSESEMEVAVATPVKKPTATRFPETVPVAPKKAARVEPSVGPVDLLADDPVLQQMMRGEVSWGDLLCSEDPAESNTPPPPPAELRGSVEEFWSAPWAARIHEMGSDIYDTTELSDAEYNDMMSWLYWNGWWVGDFSRNTVPFEADNLPARRWCPPAEEESVGPTRVWSDCCAGHSHGHKKEKKSAETTQILRFCRAGAACAEEGCRYVHADTIPRVDRPCAFGDRCGATDPTGVKRSQCLYMHPGETWTADLVITRPVATTEA